MKNMELMRCPSCGSSDIDVQGTIGKCTHCGSTMLMPKNKAEIVSLLNEAYLYRSNYNYDLAIKSYQFVLEKDSTELSAYEGILLSEYGIEYVKDAHSGRMVPTCHRAHFTSIYDNVYYKTLIELANEKQREVIEYKIKEIDNLQKAIEKQLNNEQEYDIFISYKATNQDNDKTEDALIAREIYDALSKKNYKVFFAEKSLENRIGAEYEPIIFKALHTCKLFILVGTNKDYVESNWVRNEWSRFIDRIKNEDGVARSSFIPVFKDMNPYDMPKINNTFVQGVDASKIGYLVTLVDGVTKLLKPENEKKVLESFDNLDTYAEFSKLQKQKKAELKARNWKNLTQSKGVKKWLYYGFMFMPLFLSILFMCLSCCTDFHLKTSIMFYVIHIGWWILAPIVIVTVCVIHSIRYKLNKLVSLFLPMIIYIAGIIVFLGIYYYYPISIDYQAAYQMGSFIRIDNKSGIFYYNDSSDVVNIVAFDKSGKYKQFIKEENGESVFYVPMHIDEKPVVGFSAVLPNDIDVVVLPQENMGHFSSWTIRTQDINKSLKIYVHNISTCSVDVYCYDPNLDSEKSIKELCFIYYHKINGDIPDWYPENYIQKNIPYYDE